MPILLLRSFRYCDSLKKNRITALFPPSKMCSLRGQNRFSVLSPRAHPALAVAPPPLRTRAKCTGRDRTAEQRGSHTPTLKWERKRKARRSVRIQPFERELSMRETEICSNVHIRHALAIFLWISLSRTSLALPIRMAEWGEREQRNPQKRR